MEKKTIGKFISALRKANGMTQRELGEKLFVSDKTVSRWECDECTPELSLIPSIAEIFGITTDELLRGERNNPNNVEDSEQFERQRAKSDKQFKLMLESKRRKYKNLTLISVGITILGFIAAMITNLGFSKGIVAFCIAFAFCVGSEICQICFAINARILIDDDDDTYNERIISTNTDFIKTAVKVSFINIALFAFCLPLVTLINGANWGLQFGSWSGFGTLYVIIILPITYIIYTFFIRKLLRQHNLMCMSDAELSKINYRNGILAKLIVISISIAILLGVIIFVFNSIGWRGFVDEIKFDNCADFKSYMESGYDKWIEEGYTYYDEYGNKIYGIPITPVIPDSAISSENEEINVDDNPHIDFGTITSSKGEIICEYYYCPHLYVEISFTESSYDKMPVTVITREAYNRANFFVQDVESALYSLIIINFIVAAAIYLIKIKKHKKK